MVPRSVKIEAIKYHYLSLRAQEDIDLLKEEMNNVIQHYIQDKTLLLQCVEETSDIGSICLLKNELRGVTSTTLSGLISHEKVPLHL